VYLIDEVHMLSTHSFNALLKTLEEPPLHVKFLLATTDPQKLPVTILSRCLQFNLKRLPMEQIQGHLQHILSAENISSDAEGLTQIAKAADGSMRDALSLLDQAIAYGGGGVRSEEVRAMLGTIDQHQVMDILQYLASGDAQAVMQKTQVLAEHAFDFAAVLDDVITNLHHVALAQISPQSLDSGVMDSETISTIATSMAAEDVQLFYQIALIGRRDLALTPDPRIGFEMVLLRMLAFRPAGSGGVGGTSERANYTPVADARATLQNTAPRKTSKVNNAAPNRGALTAGSTTPANRQNTDSQQLRESAPSVEARSQPPEPQITDKATVKATKTAEAVPPEAVQWHQLVERLNVAGITQQLALNCSLKQQTTECISLELTESRRQLLNPSRQAALLQALQACLDPGIKLTIDVVATTGVTPAEIKSQRAAEKQQDAEQSIYNDQTVKTLINTFDAQVAPDSIAPID
jgi:DNA polymerase-3 subunit gamma/tau